MKNKAEASGFATLIIGVTMLAFTFISAYLFLRDDLNIIASSDLRGLFGEALAPLIATCIRVMYLSIMGWIGSIITARGIQLFTQIKRETSPEIKPNTNPEAELEAVLNNPKTTKMAKTTRTKHTKQRSRRKVKGKKGE